jgi:dCTP deaminase
MLLSYTELCELVEAGIINAKTAQVNGSSIDITLDHIIRVEQQIYPRPLIDLSVKETIDTREIDITECGYILYPGDCILASSFETFNLPDNISAEYKLKSSMARNFLEHLNAGWCDATWNSAKLTLELVNLTRYHDLKIKPGMAIGQIVFFKHTPVPEDQSYAVKGQYNNQTKVQPSKGIRLCETN